MRKVSILLVVALIATSCAVGTYHPYAQNNFGAQSTVVLDKANFRVVRDVEAIVDVNNTRLSRADVASSAYGELLRKAQLTGSQVLINVVIEEVRRESAGFFRLLFGIPKRVQHVAARATIIDFLVSNIEIIYPPDEEDDSFRIEGTTLALSIFNIIFPLLEKSDNFLEYGGAYITDKYYELLNNNHIENYDLY